MVFRLSGVISCSKALYVWLEQRQTRAEIFIAFDEMVACGNTLHTCVSAWFIIVLLWDICRKERNYDYGSSNSAKM